MDRRVGSAGDESGIISSPQTNNIGRPVFATNASGTTVWTAKYLPFGGLQTSTRTPAAIRLPGQWFQSETGLRQNWMRDYDPSTGRYLQADPLGLIDSASVYWYAGQNPLVLTDPQGRVDPNNPLHTGQEALPDQCTPRDQYAENKICKAFENVQGVWKVIWVACAIMFGADNNPNTDMGDGPKPRSARPHRDDEYISEPLDPPKPPPPP